MPSRRSPRSTITSTWCRRPRAAAAASSAAQVSSSLASERSKRRTVSAARSGAGARSSQMRRRDAGGAQALGVLVPRLAERDGAAGQQRPADLGRAAGALRHRDDLDAAEHADDSARVGGDLVDVDGQRGVRGHGPPGGRAPGIAATAHRPRSDRRGATDPAAPRRRRRITRTLAAPAPQGHWCIRRMHDSIEVRRRRASRCGVARRRARRSDATAGARRSDVARRLPDQSALYASSRSYQPTPPSSTGRAKVTPAPNASA